MQAPNGVVDVVVADEAEAPSPLTKRLLGYFQGASPPGPAPDQARAARGSCPSAQRRAYKVAPIVETLADEGSVTFLRERFAPEMVTALARIEGRPVGVIANNTMVMAGAVTSAAADKAARFLQLCDAFGLPVRLAGRHARLHGRAGGRGNRARPARVAPAGRRRSAAASR